MQVLAAAPKHFLGQSSRSRERDRRDARRMGSPEMKDIYDILREIRNRPEDEFAFATLVRAEGSSYRRPGARMLICGDGQTVGSLSGGCLEEEVALQAGDVLRTGRPALMSFDTRRRFGCAGHIDIFIERVGRAFLVELVSQMKARRSCRVITIFEGNRSELGSRIVEVGTIHQNRPDNSAQSPLRALIQEIHPPIQLLICGDGPDSAPLRSLGQLLGWLPVLIPDVNSIPIRPDEWTAAIVKSHNYGRDFAALRKVLPMNLRYVGLIGPRKRRDQLLNDLLDVGVPINSGFFAPAGVDVNAETPEEIALAIVSEIQRVFAGGSGESFRERKLPIHNSLPSEEGDDQTSTVQYL
jgi:xanthine dehydrogenase accessory factor